MDKEKTGQLIKEAARKKWAVVAGIILMFILVGRFFILFVLSGAGYNWDERADLALMAVCYIILIMLSVKNRSSLFDAQAGYSHIFRAIAIVSWIIMTVLMFGGYWLLDKDIHLFSLKTSDVGPLYTCIFGIIAFINILMTIFALYQLQTKDIPFGITPFITVLVIFLSVCYREWLFYALTFKLWPLTVVTIYYLVVFICAIFIDAVLCTKYKSAVRKN
ncbi:hypothetical protein [Butyrivibrio sp. FC2001]|uniref:hypothetical protein n=1 Tax=Butyrivibrio sp. FC2001 TaxID=1280671 RepID=UPI0004059A46|nr:hypothetical protein [Butyrivibrio sp. FC2001]